MSIKIKRIEKEFILKSLYREEITVKLQVYHETSQGRVLNFTEDTISISLDGGPQILEKGEEVKVFFIFHNNRHTFTTKVKEIHQDKVILMQPQGMYKNLQRQYDRIQAGQDIKIEFTLKDKRMAMNFPKTANYHPIETLILPENLENSTIQDLILQFKKHFQDKSSNAQIIMLRNKKPSTYEEILMAKSGKSLWLPVIHQGLPSRKIFQGETIVTEEDILKTGESSGLLPEQLKNNFQKMLTRKMDRGFYSQLYSPLFYNEYFIGYVYLANTLDNKRSISLEDLKWVFDFSRILCFSLYSHNYFKGNDQSANFTEIPVIDISASGLLFASNNPQLPRELLLNKSLELSIHIKKRTIKNQARVIRKFRDPGAYYYALKFGEMKPEDFRFLYEHIYGRPYESGLEAPGAENIDIDKDNLKIAT